MGLVDIVTERFFRKVDLQATYLNALTTAFLDRARLPMVLATEREVLAAAFFSLVPRRRTPVVAVVEDTGHLEELHVSEGALPLLDPRPGKVEGPFRLTVDPLAFVP